MPLDLKIQTAHHLAILFRFAAFGAITAFVLYVSWLRHQLHEHRKAHKRIAL